MNRVLLTGGTGCIGAATTYALMAGDVDEVVIATRSGTEGVLKLWFPESLDRRIKLVQCDVSDETQTRDLVRAHQPNRIIHLSALQSPDCDAYPARGMEVNVGGVLHLLRVAEELGGLERLVLASSAAVYGPRSIYPGATVSESDTMAPPNLYGVWKLAAEHLARQFQLRTGVPTVCLRLNTTYGKGRERGKTAAPTMAMKAVVRSHVSGETTAFRMPYCGRENYHYVGDVGAHFAACALEPFAGFGAFNIRGRTVEVEAFLTLIREVAGGMGMGAAVDLGIAEDASPTIFVCDLDDSAIQTAFPGVPQTSLEEGIRRSLDAFVSSAGSV